MKKWFALAMTVVLCAAMALPVSAAGDSMELIARTGDDSGQQLALWCCIAGAALVAMIVLLIIGSKGRKK